MADEHVHADDGISGAQFAKRPGFLRLMNALKPRPPFQALIMSEESRLGREQIEVAYALKQLAQAGVHVWLYLEDRERTLDSPTEKLLMSVTAFADELEREKARQRTYDAMARIARAGHVTSGRVFGYDNRDVLDPPPAQTVAAVGSRSSTTRPKWSAGSSSSARTAWGPKHRRSPERRRRARPPRRAGSAGPGPGRPRRCGRSSTVTATAAS